MTKENGLTGLGNLGNTCFMNTCLQILSHTPELYLAIKDKNLKQNSLLKEWKDLRELMWKENCAISPGRWVNMVQTVARRKDLDIFTGFAQNDLPEFLIFIINTFHENLSRKVNMTINGVSENETDGMAIKCYEMIKNMYQREYSEILPLLFGTHVSQIVSPKTKKILSNSPEPYFMVELPISNKTKNLTDCFKLYSNPETLEGDEAWYNETTKKKETVHKQMVFWNFPEILVITLKRFTNNSKKINNLIEAPLENFDLSSFVNGYNKETFIYDLYGVGNHIGNSMGGHYFAYVKTEKNNWYEFNDTNVKPINKENIITPRAYVFFYRKKKII
jgi:ubiquitin carboxyl-terminal hydrolase 8